MKNMGLDRLVVVAPPAFDPEHARWMAPGCDDVLARMRIVRTLDEALAGVHRAVATTARHRRHQPDVLDPTGLGAAILDAPDDHVTAILFGREDFGLSAQDVARCDALVRIPTPEHASLNLAQAVLLVAHAIFEEGRARGLAATGRIVGGTRGQRTTTELQRGDRRADLAEMEPVVDEIVALLKGKGYEAGPEKIAQSVRAALQRAGPSDRELNALRGMIRKLR